MLAPRLENLGHPYNSFGNLPHMLQSSHPTAGPQRRRRSPRRPANRRHCQWTSASGRSAAAWRDAKRMNTLYVTRPSCLPSFWSGGVCSIHDTVLQVYMEYLFERNPETPMAVPAGMRKCHIHVMGESDWNFPRCAVALDTHGVGTAATLPAPGSARTMNCCARRGWLVDLAHEVAGCRGRRQFVLSASSPSAGSMPCLWLLVLLPSRPSQPIKHPCCPLPLPAFLPAALSLAVPELNDVQ